MSTPRTPRMGQVVARIVAARLQEVHTSLPGEVKSYDAESQTADVQPLVRVPVELEDGTTSMEALPVCVKVPVVFPGAGGFRITFPVKAGDGVLLVFAESHLDRWQDQGGLQDPPLRRRFHIADAVAVVGLHSDADPWKNASAGDATMGADDGPQVVFKTGEIHLGAKDGDPATEPVILGQTYTDNEGQMLDGVMQQLTQINGALATAGAALAAAGTANAVPLTGGMAAAPNFANVAAQLVQMAVAVAQVNAKLGQFRGQLAGALSQTVKTK